VAGSCEHGDESSDSIKTIGVHRLAELMFTSEELFLVYGFVSFAIALTE
jgi:hypothetical protein